MDPLNAETDTLSAYLKRFYQAVNRRAAVDGAEAYEVEVVDAGLDPEEINLLR